MASPQTTDWLEHPDWVRRLNLFGASVGGAERLVRLDADEMLDIATASVGLSDFGDELGWGKGYRDLVAALDGPAELTVLGRLSARAEIIRCLQTRLRLVGLWNREPQIRSSEIAAPLFILGPPRTGTSILLELLALDPALRPVYAHEAHHPLGPIDDGPADALERSEPEQEFWADVHPDFITMHELRSDLPCECVHFVQPEFRSWHWPMMHDLETVTDRDTPESVSAIYGFHRAFLATLQHLDGQSEAGQAGAGPRRFLLKTPAHLGYLPTLFATYPDALVIHTHRDPLKFIGSSANLTGVLHWMRSDNVDMSRRGPLMSIAYQFLLGGAMAQRDQGVIPESQIADLHFKELISAPVAAIERVYGELGLDFGDEMRHEVPAYLAHKPKGKFGAHVYDPARLGLDETALRNDFADYIDRYGIELED